MEAEQQNGRHARLPFSWIVLMLYVSSHTLATTCNYRQHCMLFHVESRNCFLTCRILWMISRLDLQRLAHSRVVSGELLLLTMHRIRAVTGMSRQSIPVSIWLIPSWVTTDRNWSRDCLLRVKRLSVSISGLSLVPWIIVALFSSHCKSIISKAIQLHAVITFTVVTHPWKLHV